MHGMNEAGVDDARGAVVPVWAVHALVTDTIDVLVTAITDGIVALIPAGREEGLGNQVELRALQSRDEGVLWIMAVPQGNVARNAEVVVFAGNTGDELILGPFCNKRLVPSF